MPGGVPIGRIVPYYLELYIILPSMLRDNGVCSLPNWGAKLECLT